MTPEAIDRAARLLLSARGDHRRIPNFPEDCRPATEDDGYAIQDAVTGALGVAVVGWKTGCTSVEAQKILGADGPFAGAVFAPVCLDHPGTLAASALHMRGLEGEFALRLAEDVPPAGAPYRREEVASAVAALHAAIEIVDSRFEDWTTVGAPSLIADNAAGGALVLGPPVTGWQSTDLAEVEVSMALNGEVRRTGRGAAVMDHPLEALAWIANHRAARADGLKAGEVVTTGTCTGVVFAEAGDRARADFGDFGAVDLSFTD